MLKKGFSAPRLHDFGGNLNKTWFVDFRFTDIELGERKPFQFRMGINFLKTKTERYQEGRDVCYLLHNALKSGWNPFRKNIADYLIEIREGENKEGFQTAIKFALEKRSEGAAYKTQLQYKTVAECSIEAAKPLRLSEVPVNKITRGDIKKILDEMKSMRQAVYDKEGKGKIFTGNTYNKYLRFLKGLFSEVYERYDIDQDNPCSRISKKKDIKTHIHRHATAPEERLIKETLKEKNIELYVALAIEELAGIRPKEILGLQISSFDRLNQWFEISEEVSKTGVRRWATIPNTLLPILEMLNLSNYPINYYIFSDGLKPGPKRKIRSDIITSTYKKLIKEELGINVSAYSFRGLGADKKIDAGIHKKRVSQGMGHTNTRTTDIYLEREGERKRNDLINNTPNF